MNFSSIVFSIFGMLMHSWIDADCGQVKGDRGFSITNSAIYYCINDNHLMYSKYKLEGVDKDSFQIIGDPYASYAKDKNKVFYYETALDGADPNTFQVIGPGYGKDKDSVFFYKKKVIGADPDSFQILNFEYNKDKNAVYHFETKMLGVDPNTFKIPPLPGPTN